MTQVAVVGGGVIGLSCAWRLAEQGHDVVLADPAPGTGGATHVAGGMLAPVTEVHYGEEPLLHLGLAAARRWPTFATQLAAAAGCDPGLRTEGTVAVAFDADDRAVLAELATFQRALGLDVHELTAREVRALEPLLAPGVRGGVHVPGDLSVDNRALAAALRSAADRSGVRVVTSAVSEITVTGGRVTGVALSGDGRLAADVVVLAAGCWSGSIPGLPGADRPPVRPVKGQILRLRGPAAEPVVTRTVRAVVRGRPVYLVPRADGGLVVGATAEERGYDLTVTAGAVHDLLRDAVALVPAVGELELVEASAGLRPGSPDNAPLVGPGTPAGLVVATGHYRNGILLAPITADAVAETVTTGTPPELFAPFGPQRFTAVPAGAAR